MTRPPTPSNGTNPRDPPPDPTIPAWQGGLPDSRSIPQQRWQPLLVDIVHISEDDARFEQVLTLGKKARQTVGFLPDSAFRDRARQGSLVGVAEGDNLVAYVLYDLPRDEVKIVQLVVAEDARGRGHARRLVEDLTKRHNSRQGIRLSCRNDFPAHSVWPQLGFVPTGERIGKSFDGKPLTRWHRSFGHVDLLTLLEESDTRPTAVLDACVFFDLIDANGGSAAEQLRSDWLGDHVRLAITPEVQVEISECKDPSKRSRQYVVASGFAQASSTPSEWEPWLDCMKEAHPDAPAKDAKDLRQIARALAAQASWLVTGDGPMRHRYRATASRLGNLRIVRADEFLREVDEAARGDWYRPVELAGTAVTLRPVDSSRLDGLATRFVNHPAGETIGRFRSVLTGLALQTQDVLLQLVEVDSEPRGLLGARADGSLLRVQCIRVTTGRGETAIGRHLLSELREQGRRQGLPHVVIEDGNVSATVRRSFDVEGYYRSELGFQATSVKGKGTVNDLVTGLKITAGELASEALNELASSLASEGPVAAAAIEARFAPYRVLGAGLPTFVVPIQYAWAVALFDVRLAEDQLFARPWDLGLRRELVYYRSPRNARGLQAPARVLWYVAGTLPGARTVRAVSLLDEVVVGPAERLFHRFERLGVYSRSDVLGCADTDGNAMALRFSSTHPLTTPVDLNSLRKLLTGDPRSRSVVLQSPVPVSEHVFEMVHKKGQAQGG